MYCDTCGAKVPPAREHCADCSDIQSKLQGYLIRGGDRAMYWINSAIKATEEVRTRKAKERQDRWAAADARRRELEAQGVVLGSFGRRRR